MSVNGSEASSEESVGTHGLSRHLSTPHLETFRIIRSASSVTPVNNYIQTPVPMSSFSTFTQSKSRPDLSLQDDPNPYSVSRIDEFRIQVQDPYKIRMKSTNQLNSPLPSQRNSSVHYYQELEEYEDESYVQDDGDHLSEKLANLPSFYKRTSSAGYDIPHGDGSGGSSEDLPLPPSDTSEEYSHSLSISASSGSDGMSPIPTRDFVEVETLPASPTKISDRDRARIEHGLKGRKTELYVSDSLVNLYYKSKIPPRPSSRVSLTPSMSSSSTQAQTDKVEWILKYTGVPVLLLDTGETKSRDRRKIQIALAELGSGLTLWKDTINHLSSYKVIGGEGAAGVSTFHTMHLSDDHTKVIGLSFDNEESADKFWQKLDKLTSDFANISLSGSKQNKKEKKGKPKTGNEKRVRPTKKDISSPCAFQHVTSLSRKDATLFSSLQNFVTIKEPTPDPSLLPH